MHIFISYSRVDKSFAEKFAVRLRRVYLNDYVWYDDDLHGGDRWWSEILNQIASCDIFIYLLSNESVTSSYCQAEFAEALRLQKRVITVQVRDRTKLTRQLSEIQYVDLKAGIDDAEAQARLFAAINKQRGLIPRRPPRPLSQKPVRQPTVESDADISSREDVDTPTLKVPGASTARSVGLNESQAIIRATWIAGIFGLIGIMLTIFVPPLLDNGTITATLPSATQTSAPTDVSSPTSSSHIGIDYNIEDNLAWQPYIDDFSREFDGTEMVLVPKGCFLMGSTDQQIEAAKQLYNPSDNPNYYDPEKARGNVCSNTPFWIDRTEVSRGKYTLCIADRKKCTETQASPASTRDTQPVNNVTWQQAYDYCKWRNARLPNELEWEYAARGPSNWIYPWGDILDVNKAIFATSATAAVTSHSEYPSWVGALNMSGNLWEWVNTIYDPGEYPYPYPNEKDDGREAVETEEDVERGLRGGSWVDTNEIYLRTTTRGGNDPETINEGYGFRCARNWQP